MKSTQSVTTSCDWLMGRDKNGERRIETLTWSRLGRIYRASKPGSPVRQAINAECRRLGYTPRMILGIANADGSAVADTVRRDVGESV